MRRKQSEWTAYVAVLILLLLLIVFYLYRRTLFPRGAATVETIITEPGPFYGQSVSVDNYSDEED